MSKKKKTTIGFIYIISLIIFIIIGANIIILTKNHRCNIEYVEFMEKWAYGQYFMEGDERTEYYRKIGFFGSTLEEFEAFAYYQAEKEAFIPTAVGTIISILLVIGISIAEIYILSHLWDKIGEKINQRWQNTN